MPLPVLQIYKYLFGHNIMVYITDNVDRVTCIISEHAPFDTMFCTIKTFDGKEYDIGDIEVFLFGDVRGHIAVGEGMNDLIVENRGETNEIMVNFSREQNAVCERTGTMLKCRATEHITPF